MSRDHFATQRTVFELPLQVQLAQSEHVVIGETVLRALPGKRLACLGTMDGEPVFFKLFFDVYRSRTHWMCDKEGVEDMVKVGIATPKMRYFGVTSEPKGYIIVFERIHPAQSAYQRWHTAADEQVKQKILQQLMTVLAEQHEKGICQQDQHLNNFLFADNVIYTLDGDGIEAQILPLSREHSLQNVALLIAQLYPHEYALGRQALPFYIAQRGWIFDVTDPEYFNQCLKMQAKTRLDRMLKKITRECSAFCAIKLNDRRGMLDRAYDTEAMTAFLQHPEAQLPQDPQQWLKNGNTCTVWRAQVADVELVVKRYNIKNLTHGVARAFRRTRASISWENAHRLAINGIDTPRPVALIEKKIGPIVREAYFITEYVEGVSCGDYFRDKNICEAQKKAIAEQIVVLLTRVFQLNITHGDLKASNIMVVGEERVVLIDLDAMKLHTDIKTFAKAKDKDVQRLLKNWRTKPTIAQWFEVLLPQNKAT